MKINAYLLYRYRGWNQTFSFNTSGAEVYDKVEIELPEGAEAVYNKEYGFINHILGAGGEPNTELITIRKDGGAQPAIAQRKNGKRVVTTLKFKIID